MFLMRWGGWVSWGEWESGTRQFVYGFTSLFTGLNKLVNKFFVGISTVTERLFTSLRVYDLFSTYIEKTIL